MTIVAFMRETPDSLLLAADSQFTSGDIRMSKSKLRQITNQQIVWSSAGNPSIGLDEFGGWLNTYDFSGSVWASFINHATNKLSELNGAQRKRTELSGGEWKPEEYAAEVLIVGWIVDKAGAYILSNDGRLIDVLDYGFDAIGTGAKYAKIALWATELCGEKQDNLKTLKIVMRVIAEHVQDCCLPVELCRIKRDIIEPVFSFGCEVKDE